MFPIVLCLALSAEVPQPTILDDLVQVGLDIPGLGKHKLPAPTLTSDLPDEKIKSIVNSFVRERRGFLDKAHNAPFRIDRTRDLTGKYGKLCAREFNLWFAAHGKIKDLDDHNMLNALLGMKTGPKSKETRDLEYLDEDALKKRGIVQEKIANGDERYGLLDVDLVEKVKLSGVIRSRKQWIGKALAITMFLDPRFADDAEHPNRWRKVIDANTLGEPQPYAGFGGYVQAMPIPGMTDVIFIEMHFVFAEPYEWFQGRNQIGAKLPAASQSNISNLRLKLAGKTRK